MEYDVGGKIFQLTAARRRLGRCKPRCLVAAAFQLTAARRRLGLYDLDNPGGLEISTHSRAKAAGDDANIIAFNMREISTHSRAKAAGPEFKAWFGDWEFQLTAARRRLVVIARLHRTGIVISTHSRAKAAGSDFIDAYRKAAQISTHSRAKAAGSAAPSAAPLRALFQLTAARRRLVYFKRCV